MVAIDTVVGEPFTATFNDDQKYERGEVGVLPGDFKPINGCSFVVAVNLCF